jgi:hypothetical protein
VGLLLNFLFPFLTLPHSLTIASRNPFLTLSQSLLRRYKTETELRPEDSKELPMQRAGYRVEKEGRTL